MVILDASIVNVALPSIQHGLGLSSSALSWVVDGYLVAFAGLLLLGGRLADVMPRRAVFLGGLGVFAVASAGCAAGPDGAALIAARIVQGVGAAILAPAALSIVMTLYSDGPDRRKAIGVWGGVSGAGGVAGVLLGGLLTQSLGWEAIFLINVPVAVAVALVAWRAVPALSARPGRFDLPGAISITLAMAAFAFAIVSGPDAGWTAGRTLCGLAVAVLSAVGFVSAEHRAASPLVPLRVFARAPLMTANAVALAVGAVQVGFFYFLPQYQQHVLGLSPIRTSLAQIPIAVAITASSVAAPRLATRFGTRRTLLAALAVLAGGVAWLARASAHADYLTNLLGPFLLVGVGLGVSFVLVTALAVTGATDQAGLVSGLMNTSRQIGGALGLAALVAVASATTSSLDYTPVFLSTTGLTLGALLLSILPALGRPPRDTDQTQDTDPTSVQIPDPTPPEPASIRH